jgi:hypothetical protein
MYSGMILRVVSGVAALSALCAISAETAYATPIQITGNYSVSYSKSNGSQNQPTFSYSLNHTSFTENLTSGISTGSLNFFTINPSSYCGSGSNHYQGCSNFTQSGTIAVNFNFTETLSGATATLTETGLYQAKYQGSYLPCSGKNGNGQSDCINWNTTTAIPVTFTNGDVLDVTFYDAEDWSIKPKISFDLNVHQDDVNHQEVPLPGTLPLFAGGLGCLAFLRLRRRRTVAEEFALGGPGQVLV